VKGHSRVILTGWNNKSGNSIFATNGMAGMVAVKNISERICGHTGGPIPNAF
jgi:hypothetical protein